MATIADTDARLRAVTRDRGLHILGSLDPDIDHDCHRVWMRNRHGVRVALLIADGLLERAYDGIAVIDAVERSLVLSTLGDATYERMICLTENAMVVPMEG